MNCLRPALSRTLRYTPRQLHTSSRAFEGKKWHGLTNILADDNPPPVQVRTITPQGIQLADGLILPSACIFLEGEVFLWDVPQRLWAGWTNEHFQVFDLVAPKPGQSAFLGRTANLTGVRRNPSFGYRNQNSTTSSQYSNVSQWAGYSGGRDGHGMPFPPGLQYMLTKLRGTRARHITYSLKKVVALLRLYFP